MGEWTVTEESVKAMQDLASQLTSVLNEIESEFQQLVSVYEENKDGLGYHSGEIGKLIKDVEEQETIAKKIGKILVNKLRKSAAFRKAHIEKGYSTGKKGSKPDGEASGTDSSSDNTGQQSGKEKQYAEYVLHEIAALENTLELTEGDPGVLQLGGYHGDVRNDVEKKACGYESHHMPSQGALADHPDKLPTIAISKDDHKLTDSYGGKQRKRYISIFPDLEPEEAYKAGVIKMIQEGRFVEVVRDEIYNLIDQCGHKYDGGIKQYLAALRKYIEKYGVPKAKN